MTSKPNEKVDSQKEKEEWHPFDMFHETNGKRLSFGLVVLLIIFHTVRYYLHPYDSCSSLLQSGAYHGPEAWQPDGCTMHGYTLKDAPKCFKDQRVVLVGDSRMRQLFFSLVKTVSIEGVEEGKIHADIIHHEEDTNTDIEFWWQPEVNDSTIDAYRRQILEVDKKPAFVVHGVGTWTIKLNDGSPEALQQFRSNLTRLVPFMKDAAHQTVLIWMLQAPVQTELLSDTRKMITNERIDHYNSAAQEILHGTGVNMWHTAITSSVLAHGDTLDGLHLSAEAMMTDTQLLLNRFCNSVLEPPDATCCTKPRPGLTLLQQLTFGFFITCFISSVFFKIHSRRIANVASDSNHVDVEAANHVAANNPTTKDTPHWSETAYICTSHIARFGLIMTYVYICDRTDLFPKRQKYYSASYFFFPLIVMLVISLFLHKETRKASILNLDQTKEWKGWMQIVILIYHYTGASKVVPIYMHLRLMVASYLFMTAYGQFCASWDKNKFGLSRVCNVIFRMNLLVFFLCLVMDRQYQLYYFVPLVSFWFLVIYITMAVFPRVTRETAEASPSHYIYMLIKILLLIVIITMLSFSQVFFFLLFEWWPFNQLFMWPGSSLYEWWFRWGLDKYIIPYGMLFGFGLLSARSLKWIDDSHKNSLFSPTKSVLLQVLAAAVFISSSFHSYQCTSKPVCNAVHSYTSFLPVTAFIILRNTSGFIRSRYSVLAAWFGDISLELFISQYHIWLAQDTKSLLVLVPGLPYVNLIVTTFVFIFAAVELKDLTNVLTSLAIPSEPRKLYTRLIMFTMLLGFILAYTTYNS